MSTYDKLSNTGADAAKTAAYGSERAQQEAHDLTQNTSTTTGAYANEAKSTAGSLLNTAQQYAASAGVRCSSRLFNSQTNINSSKLLPMLANRHPRLQTISRQTPRIPQTQLSSRARPMSTLSPTLQQQQDMLIKPNQSLEPY